MKLIEISNYNDIMKCKRFGHIVIKKYILLESIKSILNIFRSEYPEFKYYNNYQLFGMLNSLRSINSIDSIVPYCVNCKTNRCLIDSKFTSWNTKDIVFKEYCNCKECKDIIVTEKRLRTNELKSEDELISINIKRKKSIIETIKNNNDLIVNKRSQTNLSKYGVTNVSKLDSIKDQKIKTSIERYGTEYASQSDVVKDKIEKTNIARYGCKRASQSDEVKKKIINTIKSKSKDEMQLIDDKRSQTNINRYGTKYASQNKDVILKSKETKCNWTSLERSIHSRNYSIIQVNRSNEFKKIISDKKRLTMITKDPIEKKEILIKQRTTNAKSRYDTFLNSDIVPNFTLDEFTTEYISNPNFQYHELMEWHCNKCNTNFKSVVYDNIKFVYGYNCYCRCPVCNPSPAPNKSLKENEIATFIKSNYDGDIIQNVKGLFADSPLRELDIYIPNKKIAFEFDGLYWHSDNIQMNHHNIGKDKYYHINKTIECEKLGIQLIHIFENEWDNSRPIVESRILNILGLTPTKIYARKCILNEVSNDESKKFLTHNHIQNDINNEFNIGLYYNNELVSLMTFSKPRFSKKYEYELTRFCNKLNTTIVGGASKLIKYFENTHHPKSIVSYADRRWSVGNLYNMLGFTLDHISNPNYWYWKPIVNAKLESRIKYQKHNLSKLLKNYSEDLSEYDNMTNNGYFRIYDCGNLVYVKNYES